LSSSSASSDRTLRSSSREKWIHFLVTGSYSFPSTLPLMAPGVAASPRPMDATPWTTPTAGKQIAALIPKPRPFTNPVAPPCFAPRIGAATSVPTPATAPPTIDPAARGNDCARCFGGFAPTFKYWNFGSSRGGCGGCERGSSATGTASCCTTCAAMLLEIFLMRAAPRGGER